ncbi:hypothetical protein JDV02_001149 [Purpureocillium takamizusanense]|uniref:GRF-type domain-containing protein n=1 Tax=Purpureocillium takamizusanense TaxID=2060973 RepID=A0A9Q8Q8B2_9HYPO|nr:uncharacterized protein JDV02_001149 [Purpureocillium takamizusanense]UNI14531.1 hypothetical protein JDV02_001149 [Purpureocillium takamizusanense]
MVAAAVLSKTPQRDRRASTTETPHSAKKRLNGLWEDGQWWCNCEPRKPATLREVKKDTPNKGKLFWTCSTYPFCKFFLWRDEASLREDGLPSGTHGGGAGAGVSLAAVEETEAQQPLPKPRTPSFTQRPLTSFGVQLTSTQRHPGLDEPVAGADTEQTGRSSGRSSGEDKAPRTSSSHTLGMETPCPTPSKRKRSAFEPRNGGGDNAELFSDLDSDDERQLADLADRSAEKVRQRADNTFTTTPSVNRAIDAEQGLRTPSVARTLFTGPSTKRQKTVSFEQQEQLATPTAVSGIPTPAKTPSTSSSRTTGLQQSATTPSSSPADPAHDPTDEIMAILRGSNVLDPAVLHSVQDLLVASARRTRGLLMGRDSARASLKHKDERIAQLQERIVALENRERFHTRQLTNIKAQLTPMPDDSS